LKISEIVKPFRLEDFIRLQSSCLNDEMERIQFLARLDHQQHHLPGAPIVELVALYEISQSPSTQIALLVTDRCEQVLALFEKGLHGKQIAEALGIAWVELRAGLLLQPVHIAKPWGQEIWYTGIEARGVSQVGSEEGLSPLDYVIAAAPETILGTCKIPTLLKILDPLPDEVLGDLYFEMHEQKQEVYVVTKINQQAWPNGEGGIRFGFNQALRKTVASDDAFKQAYLQAVKNYQSVRQQIDALLDKKNSPAAELVNQEKNLREKMENFIAIKKLKLGDVVKVPCFTPHSLQHGVRTVEFQTPVYERKILSFAQKVLTQNHWDTEQALQKIHLDAPPEQSLVVLEKTDKLCREQVVQFDEFKVERVTLTSKAQFTSPQGHYRLILAVSGEVSVEGNLLKPEQARLLPACAAIEISGVSESAVVLIAEPL